jgi:hypothetical protein
MRPVTTGLMLKGRSRIASSTVLPGKLLRAISSAAEMPNSVLMGTATAASASVSCTCTDMPTGLLQQQQQHRQQHPLQTDDRRMQLDCLSRAAVRSAPGKARSAEHAHRMQEVWIRQLIKEWAKAICKRLHSDEQMCKPQHGSR